MSKRIVIGMASCGIAAGADAVYDTFSSLITDSNVVLEKTGCIGACFREVLVDIIDENNHKYTYADITPDKAKILFQEHILNNQITNEFLLMSEDVNVEKDFFENQKKIVLRNTGFINPENIEDYIKRQGYESIKKALSLSAQDVRQIILDSGLRGRGGAGFPTGLKWNFAAKENSDKKYVICNADEGDPGAFMDRSVLEGDPHSVIEGLSIAAYAIGADEGFIYVRAEYPLAIKRLKIALQQARESGFLGEKILDSNFSFNISLKIGAGAFVCGEETALIASIEGKRGMPKLRPPFPAQKGLWNKPTVINNVETLANVPYIILNGSKIFHDIGTDNSKGTKVFALTGKIKNSGLVEVPMGTPLRDVIFKIGGGIKNNKRFKAVQIGGPSGGCIPESLLDTPVDYESLNATGAIMGSGGMVVMDEDTCMVDVAKFFMNFIKGESCGKCTFCRVGTKRMYEILERISNGKGVMTDLDELEELAKNIKIGSLCGLGQTAPNSVLTTLKYFREEYVEHIQNKKCRAHVCKPLLTYTVVEDKCTGCTLCARNCPADAIRGEAKTVHFIEQDKCIKCGKCFTVCNFKAIKVE